MFPRLLITAGPTHEPIDAVRFIANRSSGRIGIELATQAATRGWPTTLLLGPTPLECSHTHVRTSRFSSTDDLSSLLTAHAPDCDCLIMAAAVADYRPKIGGGHESVKLPRLDKGMTLDLEATPDLLAGIAGTRKPGQVFVGFALEPRETMLESARTKLIRKNIDLIVANPLETMDSGFIEATLIQASTEPAGSASITDSTPGLIPKSDFASWLLDRLSDHLVTHSHRGAGRSENP